MQHFKCLLVHDDSIFRARTHKKSTKSNKQKPNNNQSQKKRFFTAVCQIFCIGDKLAKKDHSLPRTLQGLRERICWLPDVKWCDRFRSGVVLLLKCCATQARSRGASIMRGIFILKKWRRRRSVEKRAII